MIEIWEDLLSSTFSLSEYLQKDIFDITQASGMITAAIQAIKKDAQMKNLIKSLILLCN